MQNPQTTTDVLYSASYVDDYLESAERIPDDIQRQITRIHDIDVQFRGFLRDVDHYQDLLHAASSSEKNPELRKIKRQRSISRMHQALIRAQELSDEKMHLVSQMQELIDGNSRKLESVKDNVDIREEIKQLNAQQQMQQQDYAENTTKHSRTSSPADSLLASGTDRMTLSKDSGYGSFPGSSASTISSVESCTQIAVSSLNILAGESARGNSKRSRRRNDTSEYEPHLAFECNSAIGSVTLGERSSSTCRPLNASSQKKGVVNVSVVAGSSGGSASKKKRKAGSGRQTTNQVQSNARDNTPPTETIDPDEPTYCICNQISFGEMILCDNDLCPIEWFHFSCVSLVLKPKGKWYCPNCRGDRPNIMKPKAQFLRELERYNKEKEERT